MIEMTFFNIIVKSNKNFYTLTNKEKILWIMSNENDMLLIKLGNFLINIFKIRNSKLRNVKQRNK